MFLDKEHKDDFVAKSGDDTFLIEMAYLCDVFGKLKEINLQFQGKAKQATEVMSDSPRLRVKHIK